jgi:hypothetical protein
MLKMGMLIKFIILVVEFNTHDISSYISIVHTLTDEIELIILEFGNMF